MATPSPLLDRPASPPANAVRSPGLLGVGALLIVLAALVSGTSMEKWLGRAPHSLAWGPALFRLLLALHGLVLIVVSFMGKKQPRPALLPAIHNRMGLTLALLSVVALALRIPGLNSCMWLDEVLTMVRFARPPLAQIVSSFPDQNQHMLYSLMAHVSLSIFGEHVWALRVPSVLFGVASIWALFLLGRRLIGERPALLACALMTVSYHHIWFSQNARGYMGLLFFTLIATWLWLEAMDQDRWSMWVGYAVSIALGMWIHMTIVFVAAAHALIFLLVWLSSGRDPKRLGRAAAAYGLATTLSLQLIAIALPEFLRTGIGEVSPPTEWTNPLWVVRESLRSLRIGFAGAAVVFCGGILVLTGWVDLLRKQARAAWALILPGIAGGGLMLIIGHNLWPRFFFFCMGFALLITVHGALELPRRIGRIAPPAVRWSPKLGYALSALIIAASAVTVPRCYALPKQDFTGAMAYVEQQRRPGDTVVVVGLAEHVYPVYYAPSWPVAQDEKQLAALRSQTGRTFVLYTLPIELRAVHPDIWKTLQTDFETDHVFWGTLGGGEVYVCRSHPRSHKL
jgi:mannosyltransferase